MDKREKHYYYSVEATLDFFRAQTLFRVIMILGIHRLRKRTASCEESMNEIKKSAFPALQNVF